MYVDDIKLTGKKQNINPTLKIPMKDVDLGEPTSFLGHVSFCCTQRECQISKDVVDNYRNMFEFRISAGAMDKLPVSEKSDDSYERDSLRKFYWNLDGKKSTKLRMHVRSPTTSTILIGTCR